MTRRNVCLDYLLVLLLVLGTKIALYVLAYELFPAELDLILMCSSLCIGLDYFLSACDGVVLHLCLVKRCSGFRNKESSVEFLRRHCGFGSIEAHFYSSHAIAC
jgi:hypothetical protein